MDGKLFFTLRPPIKGSTRQCPKCEVFFFLLSFPQNERKIYYFCSVCIFLGEVCLLFNFWTIKFTIMSIYKLSKTDIFSLILRKREEKKSKYFAPKKGLKQFRFVLICTEVIIKNFLFDIKRIFHFNIITIIRCQIFRWEKLFLLIGSKCIYFYSKSKEYFRIGEFWLFWPKRLQKI